MIDTCLKYYELDPYHYFSGPGLSWDDIDQYLFIEKGARGGISYIVKRYAKANNKYISDYDSNKQSTFMTYLDKNNLHGWAVTEYLPYGEFEWLKNVDSFDVISIDKKSDVGYILEVDLKYSNELHELQCVI